MFIVNNKTFRYNKNNNELQSLKTRPDKEVFLDSVLLGIVLSKKISLVKYKEKIRKHVYNFWSFKITYVNIYNA